MGKRLQKKWDIHLCQEKTFIKKFVKYCLFPVDTQAFNSSPVLRVMRLVFSRQYIFAIVSTGSKDSNLIH